MAKNYRNKRNYRKKRYNKRKLAIPQHPFPTRQIGKLRYVENISLDPALASTSTHMFRANSIYDPNYTDATGDHQPYGHDTYQTAYNLYTVLGSKITCWFMAAGATAPTGDGVVSIALRNNTTVVSDIEQFQESPDVATRMISHTVSAGNSSPVLSKKYSAKRFFGIKDVMDADEQTVSFGSNPSNAAYYHVQAAPIDPSDDMSSMRVKVQIDYICMFTERQDLGKS